jgi:hypothetical protein
MLRERGSNRWWSGWEAMDIVEKGFNRLADDKSLIKVAVAPH